MGRGWCNRGDGSDVGAVVAGDEGGGEGSEREDKDDDEKGARTGGAWVYVTTSSQGLFGASRTKSEMQGQGQRGY